MFLALLLCSPSAFSEQQEKASSTSPSAIDADIDVVDSTVINPVMSPKSAVGHSATVNPDVATPVARSVVAGNIKRTKSAVGSSVVTAEPFTVVFGLLFVVSLIFLVAWLLRRLGTVSMVAGQAMKVVATLSVGPREKVLLIDVGGQQVLLGVAPGRVSHLQSFEQPVVNIDSLPRSEFSSKIKQILAATNSEGKGNNKGGTQ